MTAPCTSDRQRQPAARRRERGPISLSPAPRRVRWGGGDTHRKRSRSPNACIMFRGVPAVSLEVFP